jgi:hypothetical protein
MSLAGCKSRLTGTTKELRVQWSEAKERWSDAKARDFDSHYMQELFARVDRAVLLIEKLDTILANVRNDCE